MIKVIELFGGIGACTAALKRIGIPFTVLDYVEIDKYAVKSYNALNGTAFEPQDITKWDKTFADVDLIMHGSPCQDFSSAGNQAGGDKDSGTRSSLMWHTVRIVEKLKPRYVVWENVKNLLSKKHRHNFDEYLSQMADLGYTNYYKVLNAKDYGIPQNRERVFTISVLNNRDFTFPEGFPRNMRLKDLLEKDVDKKYYLSESIQQRFKLTDDTMSKNIVGTTLGEDCTRKGERDIVYNDNGVMGALTATDYKQPKQIIQAGDLNHYNNDQMNRVYSPDGISPSVMTKSGGGRETKIIESDNTFVRFTKDGYHIARNDPKKSSIQGTHVTYENGVIHCMGTSHIPMVEETVDNTIIDDTYKSREPRVYNEYSPTLRNGGKIQSNGENNENKERN